MDMDMLEVYKMKPTTMSVIVLVICFMAAVCFDSYWRNRADEINKELAEVKAELKAHDHVNILMPHKHHFFNGKAY